MALRPPMASTNPPVNTAKRTYEELEAENARLRAQIEAAAKQPAIPEGWKLVPIKATDAMLIAGSATYNKTVESQYSAMLKAAPTPEGNV